MKNTGVMCLVSIPADNEDGFRSIDMGNYFEHQGQRVLVTSKRLAEQYGHLVDVPVYCRHHTAHKTSYRTKFH